MSHATTMHATVPKWNVRGGVIAAFVFGIVGAVSAALGVLLLNTAAHWNDATFHKDFAAGQIWNLESAILPMFGCSAVLAAAGWLRYGVRPPVRFIRALGIVTFSTVCVWTWLSLAGLSPVPMKSLPTALITPAEFFYLAAVPAFVACLATLWQARCS